MSSAVVSWLLLIAFASSGGLAAGVVWAAAKLGAPLKPGEQSPPGWRPAGFRRRLGVALDVGAGPLGAMAYCLFPGMSHAVVGQWRDAVVQLVAASSLAVATTEVTGGSVTAGLVAWHVCGLGFYLALVGAKGRPILVLVMVRASRRLANQRDRRGVCPRCLARTDGEVGLCGGCRQRLTPYAFDVRAEPSSLIAANNAATVLSGSASGDASRVPLVTAKQLAEFADGHATAVASWHDPDRRGWVWHQLELALPYRGGVVAWETTHLEIRGASGECLSTWHLADTAPCRV